MSINRREWFSFILALWAGRKKGLTQRQVKDFMDHSAPCFGRDRQIEMGWIRNPIGGYVNCCYRMDGGEWQVGIFKVIGRSSRGIFIDISDVVPHRWWYETVPDEWLRKLNSPTPDKLADAWSM